MKVIYAVVTQFEPSSDYDEHLESFWSTKEAAIAEAKSNRIHDWVSVRTIQLDAGSEDTYHEADTFVKSPRRPK